MTRSIAALLLASLTALSGCNVSIENSGVGSSGIEGSGTMASETREVEAFTGIDFRGAGELHVEVGKPQSVAVAIDDNLLQIIRTEVRNGKLVIDNTEPYRSNVGLTVTIGVEKLESVALSGSADARISGIDGGDFAVSVSGSGDVEASGRSDDLEINITGSGDVDLSELAAKDATVNIAGSGDVRVHATDTLQVSIAGSGDVKYRGSPKVSRSIAGSGNVSKQ